MRMDIDKTWGNHMSGSVYYLFARNLVCCDLDDLAIFNTHVCYRVIVGFRVHDPTIIDNQIVVFCYGD